MKYFRIDKGDGSKEEVKKEEVVEQLKKCYNSWELVLEKLEGGEQVQTTFAWWNNWYREKKK